MQWYQKVDSLRLLPRTLLQVEVVYRGWIVVFHEDMSHLLVPLMPIILIVLASSCGVS